MKGSTVHILLTAGALLALWAGPGLAQETHDEIWPEVDVFVHLPEAFRLAFTIRPIITRDDRSLSEAQLSANLDWSYAPIRRVDLIKSPDRDKNHHLKLRLGYWEARSNDLDASEVKERRFLTGLTARVDLPFETLLSLRNWFEFRWLNGDDAWRYRIRPTLERDTSIGSLAFTPFASVEFFYDSRYADWSRTRYQVGVSVPATDWLEPGIYYALQEDRQPAEKRVNVLGLKFKVFF